MTFCAYHKVQFVQPTTQTLCAYVEKLAQSFVSHKSLLNYIGAIRLLHKYMGKEAKNLESFEVGLMIRASALTMRQIPNVKLPVNTQMLLKLCGVCERQGLVGLVVKVAILLGFFGFFRASNLCPYKVKDFDRSRNFTRGDVKVAPPGLIVQLKWSKSLQTAMQPKAIPISAL